MLKISPKDFFIKLSKNDLFKKSSFMALSTAFTAISRFLLVTILARYLSPEYYGVWVSITSVAAIMMFGDFGITNALRNKLSTLLAQDKDTDNLQREYFFTSFYFFLGLAIILSITFVWLSNYIPIEKLYKTNNELLKLQGVEIFIFIQITFLMSIPFGMAAGLFFSYDESKYVAIFNMMNSVMTLGSVLILSLVFNSNIVLLAKVYFSLNLGVNFCFLLFFIYKRHWFRELSVDARKAPFRIIELLKTGVMFLGIQLSTSFTNNFPTVFIAAVVDLRIAASFNIAQKLYAMVLTIYQSVFNPIWSKLTLLAAQFKWKEFKNLHNNIILITFGVFSITTIVFSFTANLIYEIVVGETYEVSIPIVFLLGVSTTFYALFEASSLLQNALGKLKLRLTLQLIILCVINFIFNKTLKQFGIESIPSVLSIIWFALFVSLYIEGNKIIKIKN